MPAETKHRLTVQEYLALERRAESRSEYLDGETFAMVGASRKHNLIAVNILASLHGQLRGKSCEVYANDMRVRVPATDLFTYPDVVVVCGQPELDDAEGDTLLNPRLIVEVLSKSTEDYDRGTKFAHYRTLPSLADYVLIAQDRVHVEHFTKQADGRWLLSETDDKGSTLELPSIDCRLVLAEVYERVQ
jgi:Uma2 family endonuclease